MYAKFTKEVSDKLVRQHLAGDLGLNKEQVKEQMAKFAANKDIYGEFKFWLFNYNNRKNYSTIEEPYDNFALAFDFAVEEPVTEQGYTTHDLSSKFGNSDWVNLSGVAVCNLLIGLREDPKGTLATIEKEIQPTVNPKYPFDKVTK